MPIPRRFLLNGASIFVGEAAARVATSLMALVIARLYGPVALGDYGYALALASVLVIVPDFGLHLFTVRSLARSHRSFGEVFWDVHRLKLALSMVVVLAAAAVGEGRMGGSGAAVLLYLLIARALLQTFAQASMAVFKAFERMEHIALQQGVNALVVILWVGAALALGAGLTGVTAGLVAGQLVETLLAWSALRTHFPPGSPPRWDGRRLYRIALGSFPIGAAAVLLAVNVRIDILVLRFFATSRELGHFQSAAWFATAAFLASSLLMTVLFPRLSRLLGQDSTEGAAYVGSLLKNGVLATAAAALILWLAAPRLIPFLFGPDFAAATGALRILTPALPLIFLNTALFHVFVAAGRRAVYMGALGLGVGVGALLCALLAPRYGAAGVAGADLAREMIVSGVYLCALARSSHAPAAAAALLKVFLGATALTPPAAFLFVASDNHLWLAAWMASVLAGTLVWLGLPRRTEWRLLTDDTL